MKKFNLLIVLLFFAAILQSCGNKALVNNQGVVFIDTMNNATLADIYVSRFTQTMSKNPRVIAFAKTVIDNHSQTRKELVDLAKKQLVAIPDTLPRANLKKLSKIALSYGALYDRRYMKMMVNDHEKAVQQFAEATHNESSALQNFANKNLPMLKIHLDSAKAIYSSLK